MLNYFLMYLVKSTIIIYKILISLWYHHHYGQLTVKENTHTTRVLYNYIYPTGNIANSDIHYM